jgi:hypothetical protein
MSDEATTTQTQVDPTPPIATAHDKLQAKVAGLLKPEPVVEVKKPDPTVDMDPETLRRLTEASDGRRKERARAEAAEAKVKELEGPEGVTLREAQKLWKDGDRVGAIAKLSGVEDPDAEIEKTLTAWLEKPKPGEKKLTPEDIRALQDEAAASKADREAREAAAKAAAQREAGQREADSLNTMTRDLKAEDGKTLRFPLAAAAREESAVVALEEANKIMAKLKIKPEALTRELAEDLFERAYGVIEARMAKAAAVKVEPVTEPTRIASAPSRVPRAGTDPAKAETYTRDFEGASKRLHDRARAAGIIP